MRTIGLEERRAEGHEDRMTIDMCCHSESFIEFLVPHLPSVSAYALTFNG
jgi:hypothetical protein